MTLAFEKHNHSHCVSSAMRAAEAICTEKGVQFTKIRRRVLEILLDRHKALGAYDILKRLDEEGLNAHPPVAYRALDFLVSNGLAHKVETLNAYIACGHPQDDHNPAFMICRECTSVVETKLSTEPSELSAVAQDIGFQIEHSIQEIEGVCPSCQGDK